MCGTAMLTLVMTMLAVPSVRLFLVAVVAFMFVCWIQRFDIIIKETMNFQKYLGLIVILSEPRTW